MMPEARILASAYTPKSAGARNANFQRRAEELTGRGKKVGIYDIQPQMWTYERTVDGGARPVPRLCRRFPGTCTRTSTARTSRRYCSAVSRGPASARMSTSCMKPGQEAELEDALRYPEGGPTAPAKAAAKIEVHPEFDLTLVAAEPLIAKAMNIDWDEKGRLWVSETPEYPNGRRVPNIAARPGYRFAQAPTPGARPRGHDLDPVRHERRRRDGPQARLRRQARARDRVRVLQVGRHRVDVTRHLVSRGHQRRRGRRQAHEALHRPRHLRHARRHQQPSLGSRRLDLRHARLQRRRRSPRPTARRASAAMAAASCASSPMAPPSSSTAAAAATPGASTSPGTVRCSGRSRRAARCSSTPCCPNRSSRKASFRRRPRGKA